MGPLSRLIKIKTNSTPLQNSEIDPMTPLNKICLSVHIPLTAVILTSPHCQNRHSDDGESKPSPSTIEWPEGAPQEKMTPIDCPKKLCMFVEENSEYCSIDPDHFEEGIIFFSKSRIRVQAGTYPLTWGQSIPPINLTLSTPRGKLVLEPQQPLVPIETKGIVTDEGGWLQWPSATIRKTRFRGETEGTVDVTLGMSNNPEFWPDPHHRLGDPSSFFWWKRMGRALLFYDINLPHLFPNPPRNWPIKYAPCDPVDASQDTMVFEFADGSKIDLRMSVSAEGGGIGQNVGRLRSAQGNFGDRPIDISDENALAWIGSGNGTTVITPTLAIKWQESGDVCGLLFDPFAEEHLPTTFPGASNYWAFELNCDETRGQEFELKSATYPDYFEAP